MEMMPTMRALRVIKYIARPAKVWGQQNVSNHTDLTLVPMGDK
jgi:hypothetical protein